MPSFAYVNGQYVPLREAFVHIEDRGYQFADGVYEVCLVVSGRLWDIDGHLARWARSLAALSIDPPISDRALRIVINKLIARNRLKDALVYLQATRGVARRNHPFPIQAVLPSLVMTARHFDLGKSDLVAQKGVEVITAPDIRWGRADIKSISLLPNVLAKEAARRDGALEAWLVRNGCVTEGAASNAWIVAKSGALITHPLGNEILGGITRETLLACARDLQIKVEERPFSVEEAFGAREAFLTSATNLVMPVVRIDRHAVGDGRPGEVSRRLREAYKERCVAKA